MRLKIISDGTNSGTKLIDEDSGETLSRIQKLTWEANVSDPCTKITVELLNIPVEIVAKAEVKLLELVPENDYSEPVHSKTFEKEVKIMSTNTVSTVEIYDNDTKEPVSAVQEIKWEATPEDRVAKVKRIKFDNREW